MNNPKTCGACEREITAGQLYVDLTDNYLCGSCLDKMTPLEVVRMCGYEIGCVETSEQTDILS